MKVYSFEVTPVPNKFFDKDDNGTLPDEFATSTGNTLAEKLAVAYIERVTTYRADIEAGYRKIWWGNSLSADKRPNIKVDLPGGTITVAFNEELDARLIEIYVLYGWSGILKLEQAMESAQKKRETKSEPWDVVLPFYKFTRNRLILLIRQALIEIENKAAQDIFTRLNLTATVVNTAWEKLFIFSSKEKETGRFITGASLDTPEREKTTVYIMGNRKLSNDLFPLLSEAVMARTFVDGQNKIIERAEKDMVEAREGMGPPTYSGERDIQDAQKLIHQTNLAFNSFLEQISRKAQLALLALPLLKQGFTQPDMETVIGEALAAFYTRTDKLAQAIKPQASQVEKNSRGIEENMPNAMLRLESLFAWGYDIEALYAKKAISETVDDPAYLPLLSDATLNRLVETQVIELGSLAYIVCRRYMSVLMEQIELRRESEEKLKEVAETLAKGGAALSLAAMIISSSNPAAGVPLRVVSGVLGLPAALFQIYSVVHQLTVFDQSINLRFIDAGTTSLATLAAIAELTAMRAGYAQQLTQMLFKEVGLIIAARKWGIFKQGLHLRDYYADLEVLVGD